MSINVVRKVIYGPESDGVALISNSRPSARHQLKLQDRGYKASVPVYLPAFACTDLGHNAC